MLEQFYRMNRHLPEWKQDYEEWEQIKEAYGTYEPDTLDGVARTFLTEIKLRKQRAMPVQTALDDFMGTSGDRVYMVTINYPDKFKEYSFMNQIIENIKANAFVKKLSHVHEYHTANGTHPHTHMIMTLHKKMGYADLARKIYAVKTVKKYCEGLNFVQVEKDTSRTWTDRMDYIQGDKKDSKLQYTVLDQRWRNENGLEN